MTHDEYRRQLPLHREIRAVQLLSAVPQLAAKHGYDRALQDAFDAVSHACGLTYYAQYAQAFSSGQIPRPDSKEWPGWRDSRLRDLRIEIHSPIRTCPVCHGDIGPDAPTAPTREASGQPGSYGPPRHEGCPEVEELPRCPDGECKAILFPPPRSTVHTAMCHLAA